MVQSIAKFPCAACHKSNMSIGAQSFVRSSNHRLVATQKRRVLIGEFRDEVYADMKALFTERGFEIARACFGTAVSFQVHDSCPDLVLLNERFPDQSGWLVAAKLQTFKNPPQVWLYASRVPPHVNVQLKVCRIDAVLAYRGILDLLHAQVLDRLAWSPKHQQLVG